ncbi:MAG TPA: 4Fe-4S cluster-binding domain-containing protein, partial [Acidilobales archaeon]|nr:4Fe-4S cluster-binding domain-containing protein [Acidilobales archaeon]
MVRKMEGDCEEFGCWVGELAVGCKLCKEGLKSTLFLTGLCPERCFYCPISFERRGKDVTFINEVLVKDLSDVIIEVIASRSRGIGITGGEPLVRFNKLVKVIKELKEFFGDEFHIHLYT